MESGEVRLLWRFQMILYLWLIDVATILLGPTDNNGLGGSESEMGGYPIGGG